MDGFSGEVLSRLPLAEGVLSLLSFAIEPECLVDRCTCLFAAQILCAPLLLLDDDSLPRRAAMQESFGIQFFESRERAVQSTPPAQAFWFGDLNLEFISIGKFRQHLLNHFTLKSALRIHG